MQPTAASHQILIVDDEPAAVELLEDFLSGLGYAVRTAADGEEALRVFTAAPCDLIVTDLDMPRGSGIDLLRAVRAQYPGVPVIIITGKPSVSTAVASMKLGAVDYLPKPFELARLRQLIEQALPRQAATETTVDSLSTTHTTVMPDGGDRVINGFRLVRAISEGNMGVVFQCERQGERYALKLIRDAHTEEPRRRELVERFIREAEVAAQIRHPRVVGIIDYGIAEDEPVPYLVMEYVDGLPLQVVSRRMPADDFPARARLLRQIAEGLAAIHRHGVWHRDIKPSNVLVDAQGHAKVTDFGVARTEGSDLTMEDQLLGSPLYMAPEQFSSPNVDARADIFSLGVLSYEFLVGRVPFEGASLAEISSSICYRRPREPRALAKGFPPKLQQILARMLRKQPDERYQSCDEIIAALDDYLATTPGWQGAIHRLTRSVFTARGDDWA